MQSIPIPKKLNIAGLTFSIQVQPCREDLHRCGVLGTCSPVSQTIVIDPTTSPQMVNLTFIHEIVHAVSAVYCNDELEEKTVSQLAYGLHQVLEQLGIRFAR